MSENLKISVIIPAFNAGRYLEKAVNSVFETKYPNLELLIIEDKSIDDTLAIATRLAKNRPENIRLLQTPGKRNQGAGAARNTGINHAAGDLIAFLDADDIYLPHRFDRDVDIFKNNRAVDGVYGAWDMLYHQKKYRNEWECLIGKPTFTPIQDPDRVLQKVLQHKGGLWLTNAITLRKTVFRRSGMFNESLKLHQDIELWTRIALVGNIVSGEIHRPTSLYRRYNHNRFDPNDQMNPYRNTIIDIELLRWAAENRGLIKSARSEALKNAVEYSVIDCLVKMRKRKMVWPGLKMALKALLHVRNISGKRLYWGNLAYLLLGK